jgi:hypothetical protein
MYFGRHFAWLKCFTYRLLLVPVLAPNYKQRILSPAKGRKVCLFIQSNLRIEFILVEGT